MRTTQYIGLTAEASRFVHSLERLPDNPRMTQGMFLEDIPGGVWRKSGTIYREIEQASPWSSGPMIFTCLEANGQRYFPWIEDPSVKNEVDQANGRYWI